MALDLERLKNKLEQLKNPGSKGKKPLWKPDKDGKEGLVRLLEYPYSEDPFVELWFHYGIGEGFNANFLCPKRNYGKSCPVCDFASSLLQSGDEANKELAKKLYASQRILAVVVDRSDSDMKPKFWSFGKTVYQQLLSDLTDPEIGNYMDLYEGADVKVKMEKVGGKSYPTTAVKVTRKQCPLSKDDKVVQQVLSSIPKVEDVYELLTKSQIQEQLDSWLKPQDEFGEETTKGSETQLDETEDFPNVGTSKEDISEAFEKALR